MKVAVNRLLKNGIYNVKLTISEFSPQELEKMKSFGVPNVQVKWSGPVPMNVANVPITSIVGQYTAGFKSEEEAKAYEQEFLAEIKTVVQSLREQKDGFSSADEVTI